ncbi:hypothetical protein [Erythrobacter sp. NFXS35]|uniref:hypothetical protein n=1 Tax=Erythrobacter sp. NFXS35 TaxID=2818436 RepID=UPI0032DEE4A4
MWREIAELPADAIEGLPIGRAGMCGGWIGERLVLVGGSNFPEPAQTATRGGRKAYSADAWTWDGKEWQNFPGLLPQGTDQMLSVVVDNALYCIGGIAGGTSSPLADVFKIEVDRSGRPTSRRMAPLPSPIADPAGGIVARSVLVAGGDKLHIFDLDDAASGWVSTSIPWMPREGFGGVATADCLVLAGGRRLVEGRWYGSDEVLRYDPSEGRWSHLPRLPVELAWPAILGLPGGEILLVGGVDMISFRRIEGIRASASDPANPQRERFERQLTGLFDHDPGFDLRIWRWSPGSEAWALAGYHPGPSAIKRPVVASPFGFILPGGETNPGKRTARIWAVTEARR